ncbi:hypothetical protein GIB67_038099 [Kingdonia uniflora]|uniref:Uncharacterized protein n=1 Tax=Kingdonia uniflora TaxID=39325 RepID=A0A7J7P7W2_9MAGN|nr:hypothetical protein GIB67_038099 [Kingdonia uniflora]
MVFVLMTARWLWDIGMNSKSTFHPMHQGEKLKLYISSHHELPCMLLRSIYALIQSTSYY